MAIRRYARNGLGSWALINKATEEFIGQAGLIDHEIEEVSDLERLVGRLNLGSVSEEAAPGRDDLDGLTTITRGARHDFHIAQVRDQQIGRNFTCVNCIAYLC